MAFTPVSGSVAILKGGTNSNTTFAAINWSGNIDGKLKDVSNFRDGRFRLKTLQDSTWSFTVVHDSGAAEYLSANGNIVDGSVMTLKAYTDNTNSFQVPVMIATVGPKNEGPEGTVMVDVTAMQHNGVVTYPSG